MAEMISLRQCRIWWGAMLILLAKNPIVVAQNEPGNVLKKESLDHGLVDWLNSREGGHWNLKQEIRRTDPNDPTSMRGVFASERIEKGELLCQVPWNTLISGKWDGWTIISCDTVRNLIKEIKLGDESDLAPYIEYLLAQPHGQLPSVWTSEGQSLLMEILGGWNENQSVPPWKPFKWLEEGWFEECGGDPEDAIAIQAAMLVVQRADEDVMTPLYDLYNHQNGKVNTIAERTQDVQHQTWANQTIEAGEEIYNTYNLCYFCGSRHQNFGTPEILQDYGFVEQLPQRWYFFGDEGPRLDLYEIVDEDSGDSSIEASFSTDVTADSKDWPLNFLVNFSRQEIFRLHRVKSQILNVAGGRNSFHTVTDQEWNIVLIYLDALVDAMRYGLKFLLGNETNLPTSFTAGETHHQYLYGTVPSLGYKTQLCYNYGVLTEKDFNEKNTVETSNFDVLIDENEVDTCLHIDGSVYVCSSFRPHVFEWLVHFPSQYLEKIERVLFIGYGNPMLLAEILEYDVTLVVGLGEDETLTRTISNHFDVKAEWDNSIVQWWFGDLEASLSMLPEDYLGSFDLIILEENAVGLGDLSVLKPFLGPKGIVASNSMPLEMLSENFAYSIQVFKKSPVVCSIQFAFASDGINFAEDDTYDHHLQGYVFQPIPDAESRLEVIHDYQKRTGDYTRSCINPNSPSTPSATTKGSVLSMTIDVQGVKIIASTVRETKLKAIAAQNTLQVLSTKSYGLGDSSTAITMEEGYIIANCLLEENFCCFDIVLDQKFEILDLLRQDILSLHRGIVVSSFRRILMSSPDELVDPPTTVSNNTTISRPLDAPHPEMDMVRAAVNEVLELLSLESTTIIVLCGVEGLQCSTLDALTEICTSKDHHIVRIRSCGDFTEEVKSQYECERQTQKTMMDAVDEFSDIGMILIDSSATTFMLQTMDSIFSSHRNIAKLMAEGDCWIIYLDSLEESTSRRNLLRHFRLYLKVDPVVLAEYEVVAPDKTLWEWGILSLAGSPDLSDFIQLGASLQISLPKGSQAELRTMLGGILAFDHDYDPYVTEFLYDYKHEDPNDDKYEEKENEQSTTKENSILRIQWSAEAPLAPLTKDTILGWFPSTILDRCNAIATQTRKGQLVTGCWAVPTNDGDDSDEAAIASLMIYWNGINQIDFHLALTIPPLDNEADNDNEEDEEVINPNPTAVLEPIMEKVRSTWESDFIVAFDISGPR